MLTHIVIWKLKDSEQTGMSKQAAFEVIRDLLTALPSHIPQIQSINVVFNQNPDEKNSDVALISTFLSLPDLAVYSNHPEHVAAGKVIGTLVNSRAAIDYM